MEEFLKGFIEAVFIFAMLIIGAGVAYFFIAVMGYVLGFWTLAMDGWALMVILK